MYNLYYESDQCRERVLHGLDDYVILNFKFLFFCKHILFSMLINYLIVLQQILEHFTKNIRS